MAIVKDFIAWVEDGKVHIVPKPKKKKSKSKQLCKSAPIQVPLFSVMMDDR